MLKPCLIILLTLFFGIANTKADSNVTCPPADTAKPFDLKNYEEIGKILTSLDMTLKEKQKATDTLDITNTKAFLKSLPENERKEVLDLIERIRNSKELLTKFAGNDGEPLLLVNGLDYNEYPHEWVKPFHTLLQKKTLNYFFKWSKFNSLKMNTADLIKAIKSILEQNPGKNLTIIGYSAGGVLTIHAMDEISDDPLAKRITFHTVASPLFGYKAPSYVVVASPFFGMTSLEVGIGTYGKLHHKTLPQCNHWVNTNCELDPHTCANGDVNPQLGPIASKESQLPCEHITEFNNEGHASVLNRAFEDIIK